MSVVEPLYPVKDKSRSPVEQGHLLLHVLASGWVKDWSLAVDGGANVGDWTEMLCNRFVRVISFEPGLEAYRILCRRFHEFTGIDIRNEALLDHEQQVEVKQPPGRLKLSSRYVEPAKDGPVRAISLDMLRLPSCGLLKLDLEGAEYPALIGARRTIRKHRPVLIVELNSLGLRFGHADRGTLNLIEGMGYKAVYHSSPDTVFIPA